MDKKVHRDGNDVRMTRAVGPCVARIALESRARAGRVRARASARAGRDSRARAGEGEVERAAERARARGAEYYKGLVTEPVREGDVGDVITPTVKLVTRASVAIGGLFVGFLYANGLPPFGG